MSSPLPRPRHLVLMTSDLEGTESTLREQLGVTDPFSDPIAGEFGLRNVIYSVGDTFLEVCTPIDAQSPGQRHLDRVGDCGYMVIFQVPDIREASDRVASLGVRSVWEGSRPGITGIHLHPHDVPGSILSLDQATPPGSWAWGGPGWVEAAETDGIPNPVAELTIEVAQPDDASRTWAGVLGQAPAADDTLEVNGTTVRFTKSSSPRGLTAVTYRLDSPPTQFDLSGVCCTVESATPETGA